jgi:hypothetical protein
MSGKIVIFEQGLDKALKKSLKFDRAKLHILLAFCFSMHCFMKHGNTLSLPGYSHHWASDFIASAETFAKNRISQAPKIWTLFMT